MPATYEPIATTTLGSAASTITFSSIPATYTDLRLVLNSSVSATGSELKLTFNNDTATNYSFTSLYGYGATANSYRETSRVGIPLDAAFGIPNTQWALWTADVFSYAGSTNKTALTTGSNDNNGSGATFRNVGLWRSTSAITRLDLSVSGITFSIGTIATLYGIKNA
jgi:hypothetical protein